jgi:hypothetical protein
MSLSSDLLLFLKVKQEQDKPAMISKSSLSKCQVSKPLLCFTSLGLVLDLLSQGRLKTPF